MTYGDWKAQHHWKTRRMTLCKPRLGSVFEVQSHWYSASMARLKIPWRRLFRKGTLSLCPQSSDDSLLGGYRIPELRLTRLWKWCPEYCWGRHLARWTPCREGATSRLQRDEFESSPKCRSCWIENSSWVSCRDRRCLHLQNFQVIFLPYFA